MKPFQIILLAVFGVLAIVGLVVFANFSGLGGGASVGTVVIWGTLPQQAMNDAIGSLKQSDKSYSGVAYVQKQPDTFDAELANALASGTGPDLAIITQEQLLAEEPKLSVIPFSSVPQRTFLDTYESIDDLYLSSDGTYGIPLLVDPLVLYYNRTLLSSAGVATPPATWEAVTGLVPAITKVNGDRITKSAVAFGSYANVNNARAILSLLFLQAGSPITSPGSGRIRSVLSDNSANSTGTSGAEAAANFYTQFADPSRTVYSWNPSLPNSRSAFLAGDLALYPGFASEEAALRAGNPNLDFDMASIPQPATATTKTTYGVAYAFAIPKVAANKNGAFAAAEALTGSGILPDLAHAVGMAPAVRSMLTASFADKYATVYYPASLVAAGWLSPAPQTVDQVFAAMITSITSGRYGTPQALVNADQSFNAAL